MVAMLAPTICMGGTLPILSRVLNPQRPGFGRSVAYLYGVNSLGAASGAVTAGFYLVPAWGFEAPFFAAAASVYSPSLSIVACNPSTRSSQPRCSRTPSHQSRTR
jgi:spermidine synthase